MNAIKKIFREKTMVGLLLLAMGLLFAFWIGQTSHLDCVRTQTGTLRCNLRTTWLELFTLQETSVENLAGAQMEQNCDDEGCTYRVTLQTSGGSIPLTKAYSSGTSSKEKTIQQINQFIADPSQTELGIKSGWGLLIFLPLLMILVGLLLYVRTAANLFRGKHEA